MATRKLRKYTLEEKREAISLAGEVGVGEDARRLNLPNGTLSCWSFKAREAKKASAEWPLRLESREEEAEELPSAAPEATLDVAESPSERRRVAKVYTPSRRAAALERAAEIGITAASKELGISRFWLYEWRRRVERAAAGQGESPTSGPDPADIAARRDQEILTMWREHPGLGPSQVRNQLRRKSVKVSTSRSEDQADALVVPLHQLRHLPEPRDRGKAGPGIVRQRATTSAPFSSPPRSSTRDVRQFPSRNRTAPAPAPSPREGDGAFPALPKLPATRPP